MEATEAKELEGRIKELEDDNLDLQKENDDLEVENGNLKDEVDRLEREVRELESAEADPDDLSDEELNKAFFYRNGISSGLISQMKCESIFENFNRFTLEQFEEFLKDKK